MVSGIFSTAGYQIGEEMKWRGKNNYQGCLLSNGFNRAERFSLSYLEIVTILNQSRIIFSNFVESYLYTK